MKLEDIKIDDMLYYVDVEFGEYEILEVFVEQRMKKTLNGVMSNANFKR